MTIPGSGFNDVALDVKYGVASGLNRDVTLNTDFAQVKEAIGDAHYHRTCAIDTSLAPHPVLSVTRFIAKTDSPDLANEDLSRVPAT